MERWGNAGRSGVFRHDAGKLVLPADIHRRLERVQIALDNARAQSALGRIQINDLYITDIYITEWSCLRQSIARPERVSSCSPPV
jgi:hypothetical protein